MQRFHPMLAMCMLSLSACAGMSPATPTRPQPDAAGAAYTMVSDRLYFGRSIPDGGIVSDSAWAAFLADVVTPRFPDGLTVFSAEGHWADARGDVVRERTMIVEIAHEPGTSVDSLISVIAEDYRRRFRQEAVLRVTTPVQMRLYAGAGER